MKLLKMLLLILLMVGLTGCYTQLEYSQQMSRVTDDQPSESYTSERTGERQVQNEEYAVAEDEYYDAAADEDYIPVSYKNYNVSNYWNDCLCSPYVSYSYNDYWYGSPHVSYSLYYSTYPYWGARFAWHRYRYTSYHRYMAFGFHSHWHSFWGHPFYGHSFSYGHPYYSSFYGHGHYSFIYNTYYFNQKTAPGTQIADRRYGPRSIGSDRVVSGDRGNIRTRSSSGRISSSTDSRTRSGNTGVVRTRTGTDTNRSRATQTRSRGTSRVGVLDNSSNTRSRSGNVSRTRVNSGDDGNSRTIRSRTVSDSVDDNRRSSISRIGVLYRNPSNDLRHRVLSSDLEKQRVIIPRTESRSRGSFFGNLGRILKSSSTYRNSSSRYSIPNRTKSSRSTVRTRSSSSSSRSTVTRSRSSSSSKSRSSGSSSSRSRGGGSDDDNSRSRGNN